MTPAEQIRAGRTGRRLSQLFVGLWLYGVAMAMLVRSELGLDPWDVFHDGVRKITGLSFGTVVILTGVAVLGVFAFTFQVFPIWGRSDLVTTKEATADETAETSDEAGTEK